MARAATKQGTGAFVTKDRPGQQPCRPDSGHAEEAHRYRVGGNAQQRLHKVLHQQREVADRTGKEQAPRAGIVSIAALDQLRCGGLEVVLQKRRRAVRVRMGQGSVGLDPAQAVFGEWERVEEGRRDAQGIAGRAKIVPEAGQGDFGGGARSPKLGIALEERDLDATPGERDGCGKAVGSGADDVCGAKRHAP